MKADSARGEPRPSGQARLNEQRLNDKHYCLMRLSGAAESLFGGGDPDIIVEGWNRRRRSGTPADVLDITVAAECYSRHRFLSVGGVYRSRACRRDKCDETRDRK